MDNILKLKQLTERAESLVGKKVRNGNIGSPMKVGDFFIILTWKQANQRSCSVIEEFRRTGFCVALRNESGGSSIPLLDTTNVYDGEVTIKLTDDYKAVITKDTVRVGCQTISRAKILELYKEMESLQ